MMPRLPATYARLLARELALDDDGIIRLLAGTALTRDDIHTLDRELDLTDCHTLVRNALALSGDPALGLRMGRRVPLNAHGAVGVALSSAPTPHDAFEVMMRFGFLRLPVISLHARPEGRTLHIRLDSLLPQDEVGRFLLEVLLSTMTYYSRQVDAASGIPLRIDLTWPAPAYAARYADILGVAPRFGQPDTIIVFDRADSEARNPFADRTVFNQAVALCEQLRIAQAPRPDWRTRVQDLLDRHPGHRWSADEAARALHVSARSLNRHLAAEGSSYRQLLDAALCRQACEALHRPGATVTAVAGALGYQDVSSFRRAFRRWTGNAPRDSLLAEPSPTGTGAKTGA